MRYWKLEEIQSMLNKIEGYENVVIEFQYQQSDDWTKRKVWECRCGIKEQLVNGQWNWLLKYVFAIEANDEFEARTIAWQEAAERLVTDVWKNSIHSFRKEQKQINNFQQRMEFKNPPLIEEQTKNLTTNIEKMKTNNTTQTTNNTWSQTKLWSMSALAVITFFGGIGLIATNKTALTIFAITIAICAVTALVWSIKGLIENIYNELIKSK